MSETTTTRIASQILRAALAHYNAERQSALATLDLCLHRPSSLEVDLIGEVVKATKRLADAEGAVESLERNFLQSGSGQPDIGEDDDD